MACPQPQVPFTSSTPADGGPATGFLRPPQTLHVLPEPLVRRPTLPSISYVRATATANFASSSLKGALGDSSSMAALQPQVPFALSPPASSAKKRRYKSLANIASKTPGVKLTDGGGLATLDGEMQWQRRNMACQRCHKLKTSCQPSNQSPQ
ncbi:hypothetical protein PHLGIDRAFT_123297 [Phlebiopsis gigantea 11061_1 CR5-6]|uniref:Uncharacterized protein n=1 Tax=Phlebiopsis gigantea (strain 11061_1 CR5-6) TaxID=745531 RepID=A0A0C3P9U6_PHLG1|nr:hypothetical protein PHLGIDRAFT_123297 [Phlebiopsis gigantea 11061_1 CR5-6]